MFTNCKLDDSWQWLDVWRSELDECEVAPAHPTKNKTNRTNSTLNEWIIADLDLFVLLTSLFSISSDFLSLVMKIFVIPPSINNWPPLPPFSARLLVTAFYPYWWIMMKWWIDDIASKYRSPRLATMRICEKFFLFPPPAATGTPTTQYSKSSKHNVRYAHTGESTFTCKTHSKDHF